MLKNIINTIQRIFNIISKNLKSIGFKAGRLRFNRLKNYDGYSFKNKQKFELQQKEYMNLWLYRIVTLYLVTWLLALPGLIISKTKSRFIIIVYMGMLLLVLVIMIIGFLIIELILHPMISYMLVVPALAILLAYMIFSRPNNSNGMLFVYFIVCLVLYSLFILILPINIFRKINPQFTFIPILSSIVVQLATNYKDLIECAYIGGRNYENLILSNVNFIKLIKDKEKGISKEKSWKERMKDRFKSMCKC